MRAGEKKTRARISTNLRARHSISDYSCVFAREVGSERTGQKKLCVPESPFAISLPMFERADKKRR